MDQAGMAQAPQEAPRMRYKGDDYADVGLVVKTMWFRDLAVDREGYLVTIHWLRTGGVLTYNTLGSGEHLEKVHD